MRINVKNTKNGILRARKDGMENKQNILDFTWHLIAISLSFFEKRTVPGFKFSQFPLKFLTSLNRINLTFF